MIHASDGPTQMSVAALNARTAARDDGTPNHSSIFAAHRSVKTLAAATTGA